MKRALFFLLCASACSPEGVNLRTVEVASVVDGDTFDTSSGERIRLLGIDAPEKDTECYGQEATQALRDRILSKTVELELDIVEIDAYDRTLAYVYLDGDFINGDLLRDGAACRLVIPPNDRYANYLATLEDSARASGAGLWLPCGGCDTPQ